MEISQAAESQTLASFSLIADGAEEIDRQCLNIEFSDKVELTLGERLQTSG